MNKSYKELLGEALDDIVHCTAKSDQAVIKSLVSLAMVIGDVREDLVDLNKNIKNFNESSALLQSRLIWLTGALVFTGFVSLIFAGVNLAVALGWINPIV